NDLSASIANALWTINGSDVYRAAGKVGIGTSTPGFAMSVVGDVNVTGNFKVNGVNISSGTLTGVTAASTIDNPITVSNSTTSPSIDITRATASSNGYLASSDFTTFSNKLAPALTSASIFVGNGSNLAQAQVLSGDATISNTGILSLKNIVTANTFPKITFNAKGQVTGGSALISSDITSALGYTPGTGSGTVTSVTGTLPISIATGTSTPVISMTQATTSVDGYLASSDFTTFNNKQPAGSYVTTLSGDVTSAGYSAGVVTTTIAANTITSAKILDGTIASNDLSASIANALWTINGSDVYRAAGKVGIGTSTPGFAMSVVGDVNVTGNFKVNGVNISSGTLTGVTAAPTVGNPITVSNSTTSPSIDISKATATTNGYLGSSDWSLFNAKLSNFSTMTSTDVTTSLGFTPVSKVLASANIFVGNASNIAMGVVLSGDATITNAGILALSTLGAGGTSSKVTFDTKGRITSATSLVSNDITTALGFTPGTGNGTVGSVTAAATIGNPITVSTSTTAPSIDITRATASVNGYLASSDFTTFNNKLAPALTSASIFVGNGSNLAQAQILSGDATIDNVGNLSLKNIVTANTFPKITFNAKGQVTAGSTLMSSDVTTGLGFTPSSNTLTAANIFVGNASNIATGVVLSGDATINNLGILTFNNVVTGGTFPRLTFNTKGLVTAGSVLLSSDVTTGLGFTPSSNVLPSANIYVGSASNIATGVVLSGDATISNLGILTLANTPVLAGTYSKLTVDTKGRVTSATNINSGDVTTALTFTPITSVLTSGNINVGNATNVAQSMTLSGDATLSNTGLLNLNTVPITKGGTGATTALAAFKNLSPTTTKGDLIVHNGIDNSRLPAGANTQVLIADSTQATGLKWVNNGVMNRNMTAVAVTNTIVETAIYSYSIPAGALGTVSGVRLNLAGTYLNNSGAARTVRVKVMYGATVLFDDTSISFATAAVARAYQFSLNLFNAGATNSQKLNGTAMFSNAAAATAGTGDFTITNTLNTVLYGTAAVDSTVAQTLQVTVIHSFAATTVTMTNQMATLEFLY
ncbi:MAG: hypothetical protein H7061_13505, partial [Bdellovibrionaceae bacterium]|nr:hypothetical protein [Bdellovibrio sp.]